MLLRRRDHSNLLAKIPKAASCVRTELKILKNNDGYGFELLKNPLKIVTHIQWWVATIGSYIFLLPNCSADNHMAAIKKHKGMTDRQTFTEICFAYKKSAFFISLNGFGFCLAYEAMPVKSAQKHFNWYEFCGVYTEICLSNILHRLFLKVNTIIRTARPVAQLTTLVGMLTYVA